MVDSSLTGSDRAESSVEAVEWADVLETLLDDFLFLVVCSIDLPADDRMLILCILNV